jgi:hypothetical protein
VIGAASKVANWETRKQTRKQDDKLGQQAKYQTRTKGRNNLEQQEREQTTKASNT